MILGGQGIVGWGGSTFFRAKKGATRIRSRQGKTAQNQQGKCGRFGDAGLAEVSLQNLVVREGHGMVAIEVALCPGGPSAEAGFKRLVIGEADCAVPVGVSGAT